MYGKVYAGKWDGFLVQDINDTYTVAVNIKFLLRICNRLEVRCEWVHNANITSVHVNMLWKNYTSFNFVFQYFYIRCDECVAAVKSTQYSHCDKPGFSSERTLEMEGETFLQSLVLEVERQNVSTVA